VLAVLDPRLHTKAYGARFLAALPPAPVVRDLARIDAFFTGDEPVFQLGTPSVDGAEKG
jgi:Rad3-related DNA helicase